MTFFVMFAECSSNTSFRTRINAVTLRYKVICTVVYLKFDWWNGSPFKWHRHGKDPWDSVRIYLFILIGTNVKPKSNFIRRHQTANLYLSVCLFMLGKIVFSLYIFEGVYVDNLFAMFTDKFGIHISLLGNIL